MEVQRRQRLLLGRYFSSLLDAQKNLVQRAYEEVRYLEARQESRHKGKEMER